MASIYFLRHGDVENPESVWYGNLPGFPLSEKGRRQIQETAHRFAELKTPIAAIIRSPNLRAQQSADIAAKILGITKIFDDDRLRDWRTDDWEGTDYHHLVHDSGYYATPPRIPWREKLEDMAARVKATVSEARVKFPDQNLLFVGHREPFVSYIMSETGEPFEKIHDFDMPKGSVWKVDYDKDGKVIKTEHII